MSALRPTPKSTATRNPANDAKKRQTFELFKREAELQRTIVGRAIACRVPFEHWISYLLRQHWVCIAKGAEAIQCEWEEGVAKIRTSDLYFGRTAGMSEDGETSVRAQLNLSKRALHLEKIYLQYLLVAHERIEQRRVFVRLAVKQVRAISDAQVEKIVEHILNACEQEAQSFNPGRDEAAYEEVASRTLALLSWDYISTCIPYVQRFELNAKWHRGISYDVNCLHENIIALNTPLLRKYARDFLTRVRNAVVTLDDLVSAARTTAYMCIKRYDLSKGEFSTFLQHSLKSQLAREIDNSRLIDFPEEKQRQVRGFFAWANANPIEAETLPIQEQLLAAGISLSPSAFRDIAFQERASGAVSLEDLLAAMDASDGRGADYSRAEFLSDGGQAAEDTVAAIDTDPRMLILNRALQRLSPVHRAVLQCVCSMPSLTGSSVDFLRSISSTGGGVIDAAVQRIRSGVASAHRVANSVQLVHQ